MNDENQKIKLEELLNKAEVTEILIFDAQSNIVSLLGKIGENEFILKFKKLFYENCNEEIWTKRIKKVLESKTVHQNDIYNKYLSIDNIADENLSEVEFIYPVSKKVIEKNRIKQSLLVQETYVMYKTLILPYINSIPSKDTSWITNLLFNEKETKEKVIHVEDGLYKIVQDYKFAGTNRAYCLGIGFDASIRSVRDLTDKHLDLLESYLNNGRKKVADYFEIDVNRIRAFIHYLPQFYYFHVHMVDVNLETYSATINRAIDLYSVIENIKMKSDYYQNITIEYAIQENSVIHEVLKKGAISNQ